ncbi:hypothetical protein ACFLU4_04535 [Chloroflexota bacterium]
MNRWDSEFPDKDVGLQGLLMRNPDALMRELRVDNRRIWIHYSFADRLKQITELSINTTKEICEFLDIKQFSRLGLRVQFVYDISDVTGESVLPIERILVPALQEIIKGGQPQGSFQLAVNAGTQKNPVTLRFATVDKKAEAKPPPGFPEHGLLIDADIFKVQPSHLDDLKRFMQSTQNWVDNELPKIESAVLGG